MKKLLFTILAVITFCNVNAQSREKGTIELIPQIGYSSSNYYGEVNMSNNKPISAINFGVSGDYFFNDRWSLRSGLFYQTMGTDLGAGYEEKLNYLTLPLNANWHFGSTRKWNLNFGPSIGFIMSADSNGNDIKDLVKTSQIGFNIGIGYKIEVSKNFSILIDYQAITGLTEIDNTGNTSLKNTSSSFNLGGVFKL